MKTTILALLFFAAACPLFGQTHIPNDADKINLLKSEAAKRKLNWQIICVPGNTKSQDYYEGIAWLKGTVRFGEGAYYEEGVRNWWSVEDRTIGEVAYGLYKAIQGPPNQIVKHEPKPPVARDMSCNYNVVLDNDHTTLKPCKEPK
jgi:hypothetical protein